MRLIGRSNMTYLHPEIPYVKKVEAGTRLAMQHRASNTVEHMAPDFIAFPAP